MAPKQLYLRLNLKFGEQVTDCSVWIHLTLPLVAGSLSYWWKMLKDFWMYLNCGLQWRPAFGTENCQPVCRIQLSQCFLWKGLWRNGAVVWRALGKYRVSWINTKRTLVFSQQLEYQSSISGVRGCSSISATRWLAPNTWCFVNMWDASIFSCMLCLLSLLQEEEEESQVVEDVDYSIYGAGKNDRGKSAGRADRIGLGTGALWALWWLTCPGAIRRVGQH